MRPWDRQPGESGPAYEAFSAFRDLGPGRTRIEAYRQSRADPTARTSPTWIEWSRRWDWDGRAAAFDAYWDAIRHDARCEVEAREVEKWVGRRDQQNEDNYQLGRTLFEKARTLSQFPIFRKTQRGEDGRDITIEPIDPRRLKLAASIAIDAMNIIDKAIVDALPLREPPDPSALTDEELGIGGDDGPAEA